MVAIGETGMDLYWPGRFDGCARPAQQRESFAWHIELAKRTGKPLMIHNRDADAEVLDVLAAEGARRRSSSTVSRRAEMARTCVDAGWVLSLSGTVSFRNAHDLRAAAALVPRPAAGGDRRAVSDPHPYRGAPNEPYCLPYTVRALAEVVDRPPTWWRPSPRRRPGGCTDWLTSKLMLSKGLLRPAGPGCPDPGRFVTVL